MTLTERSRPSVDLDVRPLSGTIGAEIAGVDLSVELDDDTVAAIRRVWLERRVVFFRSQHLTTEQHERFASRFGELTPGHPVLGGVEGHPSVFEIDYSASREVYAHYGDVATRSAGLDWHTDVTFVERPPSASILNAVVIPPSGGDTMWSDQVAALAALSPSLQGYLATLTAVHDGRAAFGAQLARRDGGGEWEGEVLSSLEPVRHPVVRVHPETGERALFVNPGFTSHVEGLHPDESAMLLSFLYTHSVRPEFVVRHHWTPGDIAFWDNRVTQHSVVGDYGDARRVIQRVSLRGERPH
ncbi:MAG: taurine dioxygenase [Acidimicrobiia bacterium]|nr:taurine dioxygenase [Acidimicrobiia bacterium]